MTREQMIALAKETAARHDLPPELVCAVVEQESGWEPHAIRYEPAFYDRYVLPMSLKRAFCAPNGLAERAFCAPDGLAERASCAPDGLAERACCAPNGVAERACCAPNGVAERALSETEARARAFSWGLMQVMGETGREFGFAGKFLSALCEPQTGLEFGCKVLAHKLAVNQGNVVQALLAWNGGGNPEYPAQVLGRVEKYR